MGPIRYIFPAFILAMWTVCGVGLASGYWTAIHWVMLGLAFLGCTIIFANFVWVFSYGYGISMVLVNLAVMAWHPAPATLLVGGLGLAYGLRLTGFVFARYRSNGYASVRTGGEQANAGVALPLRLFMWVCCSWLMAFVAMPAWVVGAREATGIAPGILAGALVMAAGLVLEAVADGQKQAAKARAPRAFVTAGLYRRIRHPNYLGEIVFQLGLVLVAVAATAGHPAGNWALAAGLPGPLYIITLMVFAARDQDQQQSERYGSDPAWQQYRDQSGSLLPHL